MSSHPELRNFINDSMFQSFATATKPLESDFKLVFEQLALFVAQTWLDEHPHTGLDVHAETECATYVTSEMVKAGIAVGGPAGLTLLTGGASEAARAACKRLFSSQHNTVSRQA